MKYILFLFIAFSPIISFPQSKDPIIASVKYKITYTKDGVKLVDDVCQLDITKTGSYFYSLGLIAQLENLQKKSLSAKQSNGKVILSAADFRRNLYGFNVIKNYSAKTAVLVERVGSQFLGYVKDTLDSKKWSLAKDERKIGKFVAQKAVQVRSNNRITAWFCKDIPFQDGPMYHYGLPGLILSSTSSLGWQIDMIELKYANSSKNYLQILPYKLVSVAQFEKAQKNYAIQLQNGQLPNGDKLERSKN